MHRHSSSHSKPWISVHGSSNTRGLKFAACVLLLLVVAGCPAPPKQPRPKSEPARQVEPEFENEFDRLVWLLGSPDFDKRKAAHGELLAKGKGITGALEEAAAKAKSNDHKHQIQILIGALNTHRDKEEKKDILVSLSISKKSFEANEAIEVKLEIKNTGNVGLKLTVPLLRKRSLNFRLDWIADMTFVSGGKVQHLEATGTKRDEWHDEGWNPATVSVKPGDSLTETIDITDLCTRPARFTVVATYRWAGVEDFMSNAVTFEVKKPPAAKEPKKKDGDN